MWEKLPNSTPEQLTQSQQEHRDRVIQNYIDTLDGLEQNISEAKSELDNIKTQGQAIYEARLSEYQQKDQELQNKKATLNALGAELEQSQKQLNDNQTAFKVAVEEEDRRIAANLLEFEAQQNQLNELTEQIHQQKLAQDAVEVKQNERDIAQNKYQVQLDGLNTAIHEEIISITSQRNQMDVDKAEHQELVKKYQDDLKALLAEQIRMKQFYEAVSEKEAALEPLKSQYEQGIEDNKNETLRLRDEAINNFKLLKDAEDRLQAAIGAEQRAKSVMDNLENLKQQLHQNIIKEN